MIITKNENGIMDKESFCEVMKNYKSIWDFTDEMNDLFDKYRMDGNIFPPMCTEIVINLLEFIFHDKYHWISYWAWELDFGADYEDGYVKDSDGGIIPLRTVEDLYNLLIRNMKENGGE